jgi:prepilin-type N-terminal cleavage/methylation domain-containing protein
MVRKSNSLGVSLNSMSGFTLIELLIVIIVLGILAMVIIPQITVSTTDAKVSTLKSNLSAMRNAIELYYHQHENVYPGAKSITGGTPADAAAAATAFLQQLTQFTKVDGTVGASKTVDFKFGPYLKSTTLPENPFNNLRTVLCDIATTDITSKSADGTTAWKAYTITGVLIANDNGTTGGTAHIDY